MSKSINSERVHEMLRSFVGFERRQRMFLNSELEKHGIRGMMIKYIITLHKHPGVSQDYLAEFHSVDKSLVARLSGQLEELGYVYRLQDENDRRLNCLYLTEKGEALNEEIHDLLIKWGGIISEGIPSGDIEKTVRTVKQINQNIDANKSQK